MRALTFADAPHVAGPPVADEFATERFGAGLRVLRHFTEADGVPGFRAAGQAPEVNVGLNYAWRSQEYETDLRLFTATHDWARLQAALPDIDELARQISVVPLA